MPIEVTIANGEVDDGVSLKNQHVREYISPLAHFKTEERFVFMLWNNELETSKKNIIDH